MAKRFVTTKVEVEGREETKVVELPTREPEPWGEDASLHVVGRRDKRMDALEKVTGEAEYTADVQLPGMLHVALARASVAAGRITTLDLAPALAMPGVRGALTADDVPGIKLDGVQLFDRTIYYASQPIAAICADTLEIAERAVRATRIEIEPLPHAIDAASALADNAPRVKPHGNTHRASPRVVNRGGQERGLDRLLAVAAFSDLPEALDRLVVQLQIDLLTGDEELIRSRRNRRIGNGRFDARRNRGRCRPGGRWLRSCGRRDARSGDDDRFRRRGVFPRRFFRRRLFGAQLYIRHASRLRLPFSRSGRDGPSPHGGESPPGAAGDCHDAKRGRRTQPY